MISVRRYETYIGIRFQQIPNRQVFATKLDDLKANFPKIVWDQCNDQWLLDISYYEEFEKWCEQNFKPQYVLFEDYRIKHSSESELLPF